MSNRSTVPTVSPVMSVWFSYSVDLAREQRLPRVLVGAGSAGEALLVAVVDDGLAAGQEQEVVREQVALQRRPADP